LLLAAFAAQAIAQGAPSRSAKQSGLSSTEAAALVDRYCSSCHSDDQHKGGLSLDNFDFAHPEKNPETAEKIIRKLRAGMMPPPGRQRPRPWRISALAAEVESRIDAFAALPIPMPDFTPLHRLNRVEYANSVKALLGLGCRRD
jgi:mono/diheme cytochrome c family protein